MGAIQSPFGSGGGLGNVKLTGTPVASDIIVATSPTAAVWQLPGAATNTLDWVNVTQSPYTADKTGVSDSTSTINTAIAAAVSAGGGVIYFPAGTYKLSATLTVGGHNVTLIGDGAGDNFGGNLTILSQTSTTANGITCTDGDNVIIQGLAVVGPGSGSGKGIAVNYATPPTQFTGLTDVNVVAFGGDGVFFQQPILTTLTRVWSANNGGAGFNIAGNGTSVSAQSCWARNNTGDGWIVTGNYHNFSGCASDINAGAGWTLNGCQSVALTGCGSELNTGNAFHLTNSCFAVSLAGCWALNKAIGLLIDASCFGTVVSGFTEAASGSPTASIQAASGATVTVIQPQVATAVNYLSGGSFINQILSGSIKPGGPIAMSANKITGLANGTTSTDAAAWGQTVSGVLTTQGDIVFENATPAPARLAVGTAAQALVVTSGQPAWANGSGLLRDTYLRASSVLGETVPRSTMLNTGILPTGGTLQLSAVPLPAGAVVGHLQYDSSTGAGTPSHWWFALFDNNLNMLAVTADQLTGAWGSTVTQSLAIATIASGASSTFTTTYTGLYYIGIMMTVSAGALVTLIGGGHASSAVVSQTPVLNGTSTGALTTPPAFPFTAGAITATSNVIYAAVTT